ncbi:MAG: M14 family zinc carboxypeptidase, partial [Bdellovibrionota bacterium]
MKLARVTCGATFLFLLLASCTGKSNPPPTVLDLQSIPINDPRHVIFELCENLRKEVQGLRWKLEPCQGIDWKSGGRSINGSPLIYAEFGDPHAKNATLIFSGVHGDEVTPLYVGLQLAHWMKVHQGAIPNLRVIVAPLVNPDGFFRKPRTRMNAKGVDINRNFPTRDWNVLALDAWKTRFKSDPRRYPGPNPRSEPETVFQ